MTDEFSKEPGGSQFPSPWKLQSTLDLHELCPPGLVDQPDATSKNVNEDGTRILASRGQRPSPVPPVPEPKAKVSSAGVSANSDEDVACVP